MILNPTDRPSKGLCSYLSDRSQATRWDLPENSLVPRSLSCGVEEHSLNVVSTLVQRVFGVAEMLS